MTLSFAPVVKKAAPAVVNIYTAKHVQRARNPLLDDPLFQHFFGDKLQEAFPSERVQNSLGSGVIIEGDGLVVTNHHVVEGADDITVVLNDRREFEAELIGSDERTDLAVLKIDTKGERLPILVMGDSDAIEVGDMVLAIGNPFGVGQTVTSGIVSATARTGVGVSDYKFFLQTDAAINPGNSGGALVDGHGNLIGINTAIYSKSGGSIGLGFAIPVNMVRAVAAGIIQHGKPVRPWLGASGQNVTQDIAESLGMHTPSGVLVTKLYPESPAEAAGLRVSDVVVAIDGKPVSDAETLRYRIATTPVGDTAQLTVLRQGHTREVAVKLIPPPETPPRDVTVLEGSQPLRGVEVANLSPALIEEEGLNLFESGVIIMRMVRGTIAARLGFRPGDLVRSVNGREVENVADLKRILANALRQLRDRRAARQQHLDHPRRPLTAAADREAGLGHLVRCKRTPALGRPLEAVEPRRGGRPGPSARGHGAAGTDAEDRAAVVDRLLGPAGAAARPPSPACWPSGWSWSSSRCRRCSPALPTCARCSTRPSSATGWAAAPCCSSTRSTASTGRSRTASCLMSRTAR